MTPRGLTLDALVEAIVGLPRPDGRRVVVAVAGPPAAGKTTLTEALIARLAPDAGLLQMDAYHFDNQILEARGHRPRKGAPHTFDVAAYRLMLANLRNEPRVEISVPQFDRSLELARNCAVVVSPDQQLLVTEGNYLLLKDSPWSELRSLFDFTVWVDAPEAVIEQRILSRWRDHGLDDGEALVRAEQNDLPNARLVKASSHAADAVFVAEDRHD